MIRLRLALARLLAFALVVVDPTVDDREKALRFIRTTYARGEGLWGERE